MPLLRVMNTIGMCTWKETEYNYAEQNLRLLHPITWLFIVVAFFVGAFMQGVPDTIKDLKNVIKEDMVWF